jgi:hypothetical protein
MKRVALCALVAAASSVPALADSYMAEVGAQYFNTDFGSNDVDAYGLNGEIFFAPVDTSKGPLAEASFLDHASSISASWVDIDEADDDLLGLGLRVVTPGDFIIEASFDDSGDSDQWGLGLGLYLNDTTDLVFTYSDIDDADQSSLTADLHSVIALGGDMSLAYSVIASYIDAADENGYGLGGDVTFYVNDQLGFTGLVDYTEIDDFDVTTLGVSVDYFIVPMFRVSASFINQDTGFTDIDTIGIDASVRF